MWAWISRCGRLWRHREGVSAVTIGLLLFPMVMAVAVGIDGTHVIVVRSMIQNAADAAALAVGSQDTSSATTQAGKEAILQSIGNKYLSMNMLNFGNYGAAMAVSCTSADCGVYKTTTTAQIPYYFASILGFSDFNVSFVNQVSQGKTKFEIALVLDNTGSMWGSSGTIDLANTCPNINTYDKSTTIGSMKNSNIQALRCDAELFLNVVYGGSDNANIITSIVPYVAAVNISTIESAAEAAGKTTLIDKSVLPAVFNYGNWTANSTAWKGCVLERFNNSLEMSDTAPGPNAYYPQYYWWRKGAETQYTVGGVNYGVVNTVGGTDNAWTTTSISDGGTGNSNAFHSPNLGCPTPIIPTTTSYSTLLNAIKTMTAWNRGGTFGNVGLAWGYRMLSPNSTFLPTTPSNWNTSNTTKIIVIESDGQNSMYHEVSDSPNTSDANFVADYSAYGRIEDGYFGKLPNGNSVKTTGDSTTYINNAESTLCTTLKNSSHNVIIYTILFGTDATAKSVLSACATDSTKFFQAATKDQLTSAFKTIAVQVKNMRLTL